MNGRHPRGAAAFAVGAVSVILCAAVMLAGVELASAQPRRNWRSRANRRFWRNRLEDEIRRRTGDQGRDRENGAELNEPNRPEKGQAVARFVKWTEGKDGRTPVLVLVVSDAEGKKTTSVPVPNSRKVKDGRICPPDNIARIAEQLKIGDEVNVDFTYFKRKTTVDDVTLMRALSAGDHEPFTFVRAQEVRRGGKKLLGVTARRERLSWTFLVPNEQVSAASLAGSDGKPLGEGTMTAPDGRILECLATISPGDLISLQYEPDDYRFVLSSMRVSELVGSGKFERLSARTVGGKRHDVAVVRMGTKTISLVVPLPDPKSPTIDDATRMTAVLKGMRQWQPVDLRYRRQEGVTWLNSITFKP